MVTPIITNILKGDTLRNWLRTDGAGIFSAFGTGAEAIGYIREHFGSIRTQDFYQIRREVLSITESSNRLLDYPGNQLIPKDWHVNDHGLNLSSEYQYRIELFGYDPNTGQIKLQHMTVAADHQLSQHQVQDVARSYVGEGGESGDIVVERFGRIEPLVRS